MTTVNPCAPTGGCRRPPATQPATKISVPTVMVSARMGPSPRVNCLARIVPPGQHEPADSSTLLPGDEHCLARKRGGTPQMSFPLPADHGRRCLCRTERQVDVVNFAP